MTRTPAIAPIALCLLTAACTRPADTAQPPPAAPGRPQAPSLELTCTNPASPGVSTYAVRVDADGAAAHVWSNLANAWQDYTNGLTYFRQSDYGVRMIFKEVVIVTPDTIEIRQDEADDQANSTDETFVPNAQVRIDRRSNVLTTGGYAYPCIKGAPQLS